MKCMYCKGNMVHSTAPIQIDRKDYHITFEKIPAWVCEQCGEAYFEPNEVDTIQKVIQSIDKHKKKLEAA